MVEQVWPLSARSLQDVDDVLAGLRDGRCKHGEQDIANALRGHYRPEHLFALKQSLELYDAYGQQIQACDEELEQHDPQLATHYKTEDKPLPASSKGNNRSKAVTFGLRHYLVDLTGVDLSASDGLAALSVQTILSDVGLDMSTFKTAKHFAAWMGLAPTNNVTGGKVFSRRTPKVY